jgi:hypothetical protein
MNVDKDGALRGRWYLKGKKIEKKNSLWGIEAQRVKNTHMKRGMLF